MADLGGDGRSWLSYTWRRQIEAQRRQRKRETNLWRSWDRRWQSLRLTMTELEAGSEIVWWWRWQRLELEVESVSEREKRVRKGEETEAMREMDGEWDGWVWNMRGSRVFLVYIYKGGFLVILYLNGSGPGRVWQKPELDPNSLWIFFKRPIPDPIIYRAG